jgi:hypothetical protein
MILYYIFVSRNGVDTRWQQYSTHLHTNDTQNNTMKQNTLDYYYYYYYCNNICGNVLKDIPTF